jgi:ribonuclease PH
VPRLTGALRFTGYRVQKAIEAKPYFRSPILSEVAAVSVGILNGVALHDLAYAEDSTAEVDMNVVCTGAGKFIEIQGTAEREPFTREQMDEMLELAEIGVNSLFEIQRVALAG